MKKIKLFLLRTIYIILYFLCIIFSKFNKGKKISKFFLKFNNYIVKNRVKRGAGKICILLPHCLQNYDCTHRITSVVDNCRFCGKCSIGEILNLGNIDSLDIKVATGGTLARKHLKDSRPDCVIAVACERDLVSGICDAFPMPVYGVFNEKPNGPCVSTDVDVDEIKKVLNELKTI